MVSPASALMMMLFTATISNVGLLGIFGIKYWKFEFGITPPF
jgi:hypothetical protein